MNLVQNVTELRASYEFLMESDPVVAASNHSSLRLNAGNHSNRYARNHAQTPE